MSYKAKEQFNLRNFVRLNSIVTIKCQNTLDDARETVYQTFKVMDNPVGEHVYKCVDLSSKIGKALLGKIKDQKVSMQGYDSATIVKIVNDSASHKIGKDSIVEIDLYRDSDCKDLIETKVLGCRDDNREMLNNKEINSVVKIYYPRSKPEFAKIKRVVSRREAQLTKGESMDCYLNNGEYLKALQAISGIQQFIVDSEDITENTIDIFEKIVICYLNSNSVVKAIKGLNSVVEAIKGLNYLLDFEFNKTLKNRVKVMINILTKIKTNFEIAAIEEEKYFILVHLGSLHMQLRAYTKAIEIYDWAKEINNSCAGAFNGMGGALRKLARLPEAIQEYEAALARGGKVYISYTGLGGISSDLGDFENAIKFYKEAIKTGHEQQCGEEELIEAYKGLNDTERRILALMDCA